MKKKYYIFIAVASYLIFLIATIPAKPVIALINSNSPMSIQGVSGTLWNGSAYVVSINAGTTLNNSRWSLNAWKLVIGQISADVHSNYLGNDIDTEVGTSLFGGYFVNDLVTTIAAKDVAELANIPIAQLSGPISINIEHAQWKQGELPVASGVISWKNATVTVADTVSLGNVTITMSESDERLLFSYIKNKGGDIKITGTAELLEKADYKIDVRLSPTATASNNINQSLSLFAKKQPNGEYLFKNSGPLSQIGLM